MIECMTPPGPGWSGPDGRSWTGPRSACTVAVARRPDRRGRRRRRAASTRPTSSSSADDEVLLPGLVDTHVHVNEPGRTEWEGFATATRAAAAGGVTTIIDMPLNSVPPTTTLAALDVKRARGRAGRRASTSASGAARCPATSPTWRPLHEAGVFGFKCFLLDSGVAEFPHLDAGRVRGGDGRDRPARRADDRARRGRAPARRTRAGRRRPTYAGFLASRPRAAEDAAIAPGRSTRPGAPAARAHVVHLSAPRAPCPRCAPRARPVST